MEPTGDQRRVLQMMALIDRPATRSQILRHMGVERLPTVGQGRYTADLLDRAIMQLARYGVLEVREVIVPGPEGTDSYAQKRYLLKEPFRSRYTDLFEDETDSVPLDLGEER